MKTKSKTTFLLKIVLCVALAFSTLGAVWSFVDGNKITAKAETIEYMDRLGLEDRNSSDWRTGWDIGDDEMFFGGIDLGNNNAYIDSSVADVWYHGNDSLITTNNGVDILKYIFINDTSARDAITANVNSASPMVGTKGWLTNPAASPVYVQTGDGINIRILKAFSGENFTITFKAGFSLIKKDGNVLYVSDDIVYNYKDGSLSKVQKYTVTFNNENGVAVSTKRVVSGQAIGELPEVPQKAGYVGLWTIGGKIIDEDTVISANKTVTPLYALEYEDYLGLEDRSSWPTEAHENIVTFGIMDYSITSGNQYFKAFTPVGESAQCWYHGNNSVIEQNKGVDILKYIYINDQSARSLITANASAQKKTEGTATWLSNPAAWPIAVETSIDGWIRIDKTAFGGSFTITFKAGFSIIKSDGNVAYVSSDITYTYANGTLGGRTVDKKYTLSFDGTDVAKKLSNGAVIGALPSVPVKDGYDGVWTIDGVEITAETAYNYGADKTATVVYSKDITETIGLGDWGSPEGESDIRYLWIRDNNADIATAYPNEYWNDHEDNKNSNYGVDILEYILIDGESVRSIIKANASSTTPYKASSTFPLNLGGIYAPICVARATVESDVCLYLKVMVDYKTSFNVTFKAGFTLVTDDGCKLYTTSDVVYRVGATAGDISKVTGYTLTFEGASSRQVEGGATIGELPAVPTKDGYMGVWTIDGVEITAETAYNYGADKTAVAVYTKDVTDTVTIEFLGHTAVQSTFKIFITPANSLCQNNNAWNIQDWATALIANNNGVDIMDYIYINGENIRDLSDNNRTNNTYPVGDATGWLTNSSQCRPVFVETNAEGIWVTVLHSFSSEDYMVTLKSGFSILDSNGGTSIINDDVEFMCTAGGGVAKVAEYTLSFEGLDNTLTVINGMEIGELPAVPENNGCEGYWTIDGVEIDSDTIYNYGADKTAKASYKVDISKYFALEDRSWGAHAGEYYFGVLDMRDENVTADDKGNAVKYLNSNAKNAGCWYHSNNAIIEANNGIDIMQYIYLNDKSARDLIAENVNGNQLANSCDCWLSNKEASPVYVDTKVNSGVMIKILQAFSGNYFELTFKAGFSLENDQGVRVYLSQDVTYKYIETEDGTTLAKGKITDAELDELGGKEVTLMNNGVEYLVKTTCLLTLPEIDPVIVGEEGLSQVLVGWTTDPTNLSNLYPVGHKLKVTEEMTLHTVWVGFELQDGAAVRLTAGSSGIRFLTDIDAGAYKIGVEKGLITGVGTFLVPTDYLEMGMDFVHGSFSEGYYMDRVTETWKVNGESDATWTYVAAFVNISESQYSRRFSARGYLKVQFTTGEGYVYTPYNEKVNARSIYEVAVSAYNDEENPGYQSHATILNYVNSVANLTWNGDDYSFEKTANVPGNYEITDISVDGNVVTVKLNGDISSAVVNGKRLAASKDQSSNVAFGDLIFNVSEFKLIDGGFEFKLGASDKTAKDSEDTLYFDSSSEDLDFFLNDFFKRHSGLVEDGKRPKVNSTVAGVSSEEFFSHEWMSTAYYWFNSFEGFTNEQGINEDRIKGLRTFLSTIPVDDYGYVWSSNDRVRDAYTKVSTGEQKMGWPFPNNDTVSTSHWEFNSSSESWTNNISASASAGLYGKNLSNQSSNITFTSNTFNSLTSNKIYTFYAPLLEFEVRIGDATNIEDIYVWYSTSSSTSFSEDKKVSVKDKAFFNYDIGNTTGEYNHVLYLPMYAESAWGESTSTYVKQIKIEIALKSGKTISGYVGLNYVRPTLDTRMSNNNSILISSLRTDYEYTGDLDYLAENITRARKAMNFLMQMYDSTRGLKKESYLVGHGGTKESLNWLGKATNKSIASSISQGYWDIMYMPEYDFQSNTYFYKALRDLAYLEDVLVENGITVDEDATVKTATRNRTTGTSPYSYDLSATADTVLANLRQTTEDTNHTGFWDATDGRFVAGYASGEGKWYDYGYVAWNLEAIYHGIATEEQAKAIMNWLNSESNLYKYAFAPLSITVTGDADALNGEYAAKSDKWVNCQFGGAILYTSYYDLMARIETLGADDAFERFTAIQNWYKEVYDYYVANGTDPYDFYRYYYDNKKIQCQGMGKAGAVGLDREFLESFLPISAVANGFFGIEGKGKNLEVAPELPADLDYWKMENLAFNFVKYDLTIFENAIQLNNVRGDASGLTLTVALDYANGQSVYVNGAKVTPDKVENGKAYVTVNFGATIVEVK